ncbi:MAG: hypothetical protein ACFFBP_17705 [Promethearchaeota archaeon]
MIQENEVITFFLCLGALSFVVITYVRLKTFPKLRVIIVSFILFSLGWFFTIIEGIFFEEISNIIEHLCYLSSSIILGLWTLLAIQKKRDEDESDRNS